MDTQKNVYLDEQLAKAKRLLKSVQAYEPNRLEKTFVLSTNYFAYSPRILLITCISILLVGATLELSGIFVSGFQRSGALVVCSALIFASWKPANAMFLGHAERALSSSHEILKKLDNSIEILTDLSSNKMIGNSVMDTGYSVNDILQKLIPTRESIVGGIKGMKEAIYNYKDLENKYSGRLLLTELVTAATGTFVWGFGDLIL